MQTKIKGDIKYMVYSHFYGATKARVNKLALLAVAIVFASAGAAAVYTSASAGNGNSQGGDAEKGNSLRSAAEPVEVVSVEAKTSDTNKSNFDEEYTYYKVTFEEAEYDRWVYREAPRLGGDNFVSPVAGTSNAFWFGVSAPDGDGIQHEIEHKGQVTQYFDNDDGDVRSLTAQFNGKGELLHVNGVQPE